MKKLTLFVSAVLAGSIALGQAITDDGTNVGVGNATPSHRLDVDGDVNISVGNKLLINSRPVVSTVGTGNTFIGDLAGNAITTGYNNAFIGYKSGEVNSSGHSNAFIGFKAGENNTTGASNAFIGQQAGRANLTGHTNVMIGRRAGFNSAAGDDNVFVGHFAGQSNVGGSSNTYIGSGADGSAGLTNATAIGAGAIATMNNTVILGNGARVGIGNSAPGYDLDVAGDVNFTGTLYQNGVPFSGGGGATGPTGPAGADGANGSTGATGPAGPTGANGLNGSNGLDGADGATGATGPAGADGANGSDGATGPTGPAGADGVDGATGATGPLVAGTTGQTLRYNGSSWEGSSLLVNDGAEIGIGGTPQARFHLFAEDTTIGGGFRMTSSVNTSQDWYWYIPSSENLVLRDDGSDLITFQNGTGRVGIGTDNPLRTLDVQTNSTAYAAYVQQTGSGGGLQVYNNTTSASSTVFSATSLATGMVVKGNGAVGIGTTSPDYTVDIQSDLARGIDLVNEYTGASTKYGIYNNVNNGGTGIRYGIYNFVDANSADNSSTYGIRTIADGNGNAGSVYGMYSSCNTSGTGNRYAIYGSASTTDPSATTKSWAGYFSGNTYFTADVRMGYTDDVPGYKLAVNGKIICEELKVQDSGDWPDYVFTDEYDLKTLEEVEAHIEANSHLPGVPNAATVEEEGIMIGEMQKVMMEKIEELTLYMIDANKQIKASDLRIKQLEEELKAVKATK